MEIDFLTTVNLINKEEIGNHPDKTLIENCMKLKDTMLLDLVHVLRDSKKCPDYMFELGRIQEQAMRVMVPTNKLVQLQKENMQSVAYPGGEQ